MNLKKNQPHNQLPKKITVHQTTDRQGDNLAYELNEELEKKVSKGAAEIVQIAKELAVSNRKLKKANKQLESFAYTVSHDLQEPLRSINLFTQLLQEDYQARLDEQGREYLDYIIGSTTRMQTLIQDVLTYCRAGKGEQTWLETDLKELVKTVIIDLQKIIKETQAEIIIDNLPTVIVNQTEIRQLFLNLISNSLKFRSQQKLRIKISSQLENNQWLIKIQDNGIGIEAEAHNRIFQAFTKLHSPEQYTGSGVGLAICQKIIERHQGSIRVESELGKGATFYFTLPQSP